MTMAIIQNELQASRRRRVNLAPQSFGDGVKCMSNEDLATAAHTIATQIEESAKALASQAENLVAEELAVGKQELARLASDLLTWATHLHDAATAYKPAPETPADIATSTGEAGQSA